MASPVPYIAVIVLLVLVILFYPSGCAPTTTMQFSSSTGILPSRLELTVPQTANIKERQKKLTLTEEVRPLSPWGYNANRNIHRWNVMYKSVLADVKSSGRSSFSLIDYGSDQGYFSISFAHFFPNATVMGVEAGTPGIVFRTKDMDVLKIQETYIDSLSVTNMHICQAFMHQDMFVKLNEAHAVVDYQLFLSVMHWFQLPDRAAFEFTLVQLLRNAKTTFLELPSLGDDGPTFRAQMGYALLKKWYDGRKDIAGIIGDAASAHHLPVKVTNLMEGASVFARIVYRVDVEGNEQASLHCNVRRKVYGCANREKHSQCVSSPLLHLH